MFKYLTFLIVLIGYSLMTFGSGCSIPITNIEFCRDKGKFGAICAYWLNAKDTKKIVSITDWNAKRLGMVCTSEAGMGNINAIIEKLCQGKKCTEQVKELISTIEIGVPSGEPSPSPTVNP